MTIEGETCVRFDGSRGLDATRLWHLRLDHISKRSLDILWKMEMTGGEIFKN